MQSGANPAIQPATLPEARERKIVFLLWLVSVIHVLFFSAVFPFFNVVDEQQHFDVVVRYSHADFPRAMEPLSDEAMNFVAVYHSPEYLWPPSHFADGKIPPPPWTLPMNVIGQYLLDTKALWKSVAKNQEASQPPLYYSLAALWWHFGKTLGLDGGHLLYWLRFLNIFFMAALVWTGFIAARKVFPENSFLRLAVPAILAFIPQTAFYAIQNDVLSPLCFGAAFILLLKFWRAEIPDARLGVCTGLALAATFLAKVSNVPLLAVAAVFVALKIFQLARAGKIRAAAPAISTLAVGAALPVALWLAWCKHNFGDLTGSAAKFQILGWTHKPFAEWWHHPIFTPHGFWAFFSDLLATFWQGELLWDRQPLALPLANHIYVFITMILLTVALVSLLKKSSTLGTDQRNALWFGFVCFAAAVAFLGLLSTTFDFHDCFRPSRDFPYFTSGRMMLGVLIPFLLLFTFGLDQALKKFSNATKFMVLAVGLGLMLAAEIATDWPIYPNPYNWFHM
jgi:branched-subunit amino acid transport protein